MLPRVWGTVQSRLYCFSHLILITISESLANIIVFMEGNVFHRGKTKCKAAYIR